MEVNWTLWFDALLGYIWTKQKDPYIESGLPYSADVKETLIKNWFDLYSTTSAVQELCS